MKISSALSKAFLLFICACMLLSFLSSLAFAYDGKEKTAEEKCEVIIEFEDRKDPNEIKKRIFEIVNGDLEIIDEYNTVFYGMSALIPQKYILALECTDGVESLSLSAEYKAMDTVESRDIKRSLNDLSYGNGLDGEGMVIAVLDSGFLIDDPYFALSEGKNTALSKDDIDMYKLWHGFPGKYISEKIPYAYDYGDDDFDVSAIALHGHHVAGIIAANPANVNDDSDFSGVAPEAQLVLMKIFCDETGTTKTSAILSALEDAVLIGADVINLSLGIACGNEEGKPLSSSLRQAIIRAEDMGSLVVCATGNSGVVGEGSIYDKEYGLKYPLADNVDTGTVASPASIDKAFSVGGLKESYKKKIYFLMGGETGMSIAYTDTNMYYDIGNKRSFAELLGRERTAVFIRGDGTFSDFENIKDLNGRLVIVRYRGEMSIENKMILAKEAGASGVIFYVDKGEDALSLRLNLANAVIPAILVSYDDSIALRENIGDVLVFSDDFCKYELVEGSRAVAEYSSGGVSGDMVLNPDLVAPADAILSLGADGLMTRSGTSMAAAYVSGTAALLKTALIKEGIEFDVAVLRNILMNSAVPLKDDLGVYEYSPRIQGAGMIDLYSAINTEILMSSANGQAKIEIKDPLPYIFSFNVTIDNLSSEQKDCYLSVSVMTDVPFKAEVPNTDGSIKTVNFNTGRSEPFENSKAEIDKEKINVNKYSEDGEKLKISLEPNASRTVQITIYMDAKAVSEKNKIFSSGFFVEGFVEAYSENGDMIASIPYVGFRGNRNNMSVFDGMLYENENFFDSGYLYTYVYNSIVIAGSNNDTDEAVYSYDYISFSPNGDGIYDELYLSLSLLRNVKKIKYEIISSNGSVIYSNLSTGYTVKTHLDGNFLNTVSFKVWDGLKIDGTPYPDGLYTLRVTAVPDYRNSSEQTIEFTVELDTQKPEMINSWVETDLKGKVYLMLEFKDNHHMQSLGYFSYVDGTGHRFEDSLHVSGDITKGENTVFALDITFINAKDIYITASDFAFNRLTYKYELQQVYENIS